MSGDGIDRAVTAGCELELGRVPEPVLAHTERVIADTVAVVRAGARASEVKALVADDVATGLAHPWDGDYAVKSSPTSSATVLTTPMALTSAANAAFVNATAGTFLELDEGMRPTGHPAMHVVPAAIAVAETHHATGRELVRATLAGYEVTSRLFSAFRLRHPIHPHGHFGAVGAGVAAAMLQDIDPLLVARIAATTPLMSVWDSCYEGATARNTYTGQAAQSGIRSCELACAGFTGSHEGLAVAFSNVGGELIDESALSAELSYDKLGITRNYFKRHSACALSHAAIDAVFGMDLPPVDQIRSGRVETVRNNMKLDRQPQPNDLSARFSLPYAVATAIVIGRSDPDAFRYRPEVAELASRIDVRVAADLEAVWPHSSPARVTVQSSDGEVSNTVDNPRGHHSQPLTITELHDKFLQLVDDAGRSESLWACLNSLRDVGDCAMLFDGLSR